MTPLPARLYAHRDYRLYTLIDAIAMNAMAHGFGEEYIEGWIEGLRQTGEINEWD